MAQENAGSHATDPAGLGGIPFRLKEVTALNALKGVQSDLSSVVFLFREEVSGAATFLSVGEGLRGITGDDPQDVLSGKINLFDRILPQDLSGVLARITESRRYMTPWQHEFRFQSPGGTPHWVLANCTPYRGDRGTTLWQGMLVDITHLKEATYALAPAEHRMDLSVDDIHAVVWKLETASGRLSLSGQWERVFGFAPGTRPATLDELLALVHQGDLAAVRSAFHDVGLARGTQQAIEFRLKTGNGDHLWVASRFEASAGEGGFVHGIFVDITERKRVELDLFEAKKAAEKYANRISGELRTATEALERAERRLNLALTGAKAMVVEVDMMADRVEFSDHWDNMPGLSCLSRPRSLEELFGIFVPEDAARFREMLEATRAEGNGHTREFRLKTGETSWLWVSAHLEPARDDRRHIHCVFMDATERKRIEHELHEVRSTAVPSGERDELAGTVEVLQQELLVTKDAAEKQAAQADAEIKAISDALSHQEKHLNLVLEGTKTVPWKLRLPDGPLEISSRWDLAAGLARLRRPQTLEEFFSRVHPGDAAEVRAAFQSGAKAGERQAFEFRLQGEGEVPAVWVAAWLESCGDTDIHGVFMDISERKQAGDDLSKARGLAESAAQVKQEFLGIMSHEIRTPLNGVLGSAELLANTPLSNEQADHLRTIKDCSTTLLAFLNDILSYSQLGDSPPKLNIEPCDLRTALLSAIDIFRADIAEKGLQLSINGFETLPSNALCDAPRLRQVLQCLVSNAVKFTEKGEIRVTAGCIHRDRLLCHVEISVLDTGIGIPEEDIGRIFDPFFQSDSSTSRNFGGAGIGLAIAKRLADAMSAEIKMETRVGEGSCFRILFECHTQKSAEIVSPPPPMAAAQTAPVPVPAPAPAPVAGKVVEDLPELKLPPAEAEKNGAVQNGNGNGSSHAPEPARAGNGSDRRALIVEDNAINRKLFRVMLERFGVIPEEAVNGLQGFEKAAATAYDIIFMDVQMPEMDGCEAARAIRDLPSGKSTRIVALTAFAGPEARERCFAAGMDYFLSKPVKLEDLQLVLGGTER